MKTERGEKDKRIKVECPSCGETLKLRKEMPEIVCPVCGETFATQMGERVEDE